MVSEIELIFYGW